MKKISEVLDSAPSSPIYGEFWRIHKIWQKSVTKNTAEVTTPIKIEKQTLTVLVHNDIWCIELNHLKTEIKEKLAINGLNIEELVFKYKPVYVKQHQPPKRQFYEITPKMQSIIEETTKNMDNTELILMLTKAMTAYFKRYGTNL